MQPLYKVRFRQADVWKHYIGPSGDNIEVDVYEHWLEPMR
jgi:nitrile hydratase